MEKNENGRWQPLAMACSSMAGVGDWAGAGGVQSVIDPAVVSTFVSTAGRQERGRGF